jgi:ribosomal protein L11
MVTDYKNGGNNQTMQANKFTRTVITIPRCMLENYNNGSKNQMMQSMKGTCCNLGIAPQGHEAEASSW